MSPPASTSTAQSATLASARLPRRTRQALEHLLAVARPMLEQQIPYILQEAELALARTPSGSDPKLEEARMSSMRSLGGGIQIFLRSFFAHVEASLASLQAARRRHDAADDAPVLTLTLLDEDIVSDDLVLENMGNRVESRNSLGLQLLGQRFGVLAGAPALDGMTLPLGPHALCNALADAADAMKLSRYARMQLFQQFEKSLMEHYPALLDALNARLVEDGILPYLSFVPMRVRGPAPHVDAHDAPPPPAAGFTAPAVPLQPAHAPPPATPAVDAGFAALQALLQQRRTLLEKLRPGNREERSLETLGREEVLEVLQRLRASTGTGKSDTLADFRQILLAQARQAHGHGVALSSPDSDSFDLLTLFMTQLQRDMRRSSPGEALLERLRLPLAQMSLRDPSFFTEDDHPARQLLDAISMAGASWLADDDMDAQWLGLLQRAASAVQQDTSGSPETFAEANQTLQSGLQALDRKAEMAERRQVEAARGRERLELARRHASAEIARLVEDRHLPRFHALLMEQTWVDVLSLAHLRNGADSDAWRQLLDVTARIIDAGANTVPQPMEPDCLEQIRTALGQVGYHAEDAATIAAQLANEPGSADELASRTEILVQLRARARLGEENATADNNLPPRSPEEQAAYLRLRNLRVPTWIELDEGQEQPQRRRLAWVSANTDQALLVNRRGLRAGNDDLDTLARKLAAGKLRLLEEHPAPATAAWNATVNNLQRIAGSAGDEGAGP